MKNKKTIANFISIKSIHYLSGLTLSVFIFIHLINHLLSILDGPELHIEWMEKFRKIYRNQFVELLLLTSVLFQIITGIYLLFANQEKIFVKKIQIYSGLYLSFFLVIHVSAVITGRQIEHLDTNFYYAGVGLNFFPSIFIPYYFLSVVAVFLHVASLHYINTNSMNTSILIGIIGILISILIILGFTDFLQWREMPLEYINFINKYLG